MREGEKETDRLARLIAEHTSTESKLKARVEFLERQLQRYSRRRQDGEGDHSKAAA